MTACSQPALTVTRPLQVLQREWLSQVAASNVSSIDVFGQILILSCRSGGCRYCRRCWEAYLMAEDLRAPGHEDSIGDFKAGADGDSTLPSAAKITSTRLGLVCFICLINFIMEQGSSSAEHLQFLKNPHLSCTTKQLFHDVYLAAMAPSVWHHNRRAWRSNVGAVPSCAQQRRHRIYVSPSLGA
jgi:hypothetical protein